MNQSYSGTASEDAQLAPYDKAIGQQAKQIEISQHRKGLKRVLANALATAHAETEGSQQIKMVGLGCLPPLLDILAKMQLYECEVIDAELEILHDQLQAIKDQKEIARQQLRSQSLGLFVPGAPGGMPPRGGSSGSGGGMPPMGQPS